VIRQLLSLTFACGLLGVSSYYFICLLFFSHGFYFWMVTSSGMGIFFGAYWLWEDFIFPMLKRGSVTPKRDG